MLHSCKAHTKLFVLIAELILLAQGTQKVIKISVHICLGNISIRFGIPKREQSGNEHEFAIDNFDLLHKLKDLIEGFMSSHSKTNLKCYCSRVYLQKPLLKIILSLSITVKSLIFLYIYSSL